MNTPIGKTTLGELLPYDILIAILVLLFVFCFYMAVKTSKAKRKAKKILKQAKIDLNKQMKENKASHVASFKHMTGLPAPEGSLCTLFLCPDKIEIDCNGTKFNLNKSKIISVDMKTDVEIQKQYVSSIGGAVGGAVVFGALGAMIGGRAKEKKSSIIHTYLIFSYKKDEDIDYISFDITNCLPKATKFIEDFRSQNQDKLPNSIDL